MKKRIIVGLGIFALIFSLGGVYIIVTIEDTTSRLDRLILLHQVEILREHLLIQIKRVQSDLDLENTRFSRGADTIVADSQNMSRVVDTCFDCHHTESVLERLKSLREDVEKYKGRVSRALTVRAESERLSREEDEAFKLGEQLVTEVTNIIAVASMKLEEKTNTALNDIRGTQKILFLFVAMAPILAISLGFIFMRAFTKPLHTVLDATRRLRAGDLDFRLQGLKDECGEVGDSFNLMADSLKEQLNKIEESEKRYRLLFEKAGDAIFILDTEGQKPGQIVAANQAAALMHGHTIDELLTLNISDLDIPEIAGEIPARIARILNGEWINEELSHRKKDGTVFPVAVSAGLFELGNHRYILAFDRDITENKRAEKALMESEKRYRLLFEKAGDAILILDTEGEGRGRIVAANEAAAFMHGYTVDELIGMSIAELDTEEAAKNVEKRIQKMLEGKWLKSEINHCRKDGTVFPVEVSAGLLELDNRSYILTYERDISARKQAEESLRRTQQMKMVGELAAGLAHEIKNPLAGIKTAMEILSNEACLAEEDRDVLVKVVGEIKRIELLIRDLLNFARPPKQQPAAVNVNSVIESALTFSLRQGPLREDSKSIMLVKDLDARLPEIVADPLQLQQIFLNLLLNARDAMPDGGTINIRTFLNIEKDLIEVEIADTGKGIDEEMRDKVFQPFFTTKSRGTGLGLAITKRLIEEHCGTISVRSGPGKGTTFEIALPLHRKEVQII